VHQRFGASKGLWLLFVMIARFAEHCHAPIIQNDATHSHLKNPGFAFRIKCPNLGNTHVLLCEILPVLLQALVHGMRHVGCHISGPQLFQTWRACDFQSLFVGPNYSFFVEIKNPNTGVKPVIDACNQAGIEPGIGDCCIPACSDSSVECRTIFWSLS
jgi:hypothetical protein